MVGNEEVARYVIKERGKAETQTARGRKGKTRQTDRVKSERQEVLSFSFRRHPALDLYHPIRIGKRCSVVRYGT